MAARQYSNKATPATLGGGISSSDTSLSLSTVAGLPASFPYTLVIEPDSSNAEVVTVTALAGTIATVTRGQDGTTAVAHAASSTVYHDHSARDFQEPQDHIAASTNVHGLSGGAAVVGTSQSQTLTNKVINWLNNTITMTKAQLNAALSDADVATLDGSETLTNKTVALGSNTVSGTTAQFNTALSDNDFATQAGAESLTNKVNVGAQTVTASTHVQSPETTAGSGRTAAPYVRLAGPTGLGSQAITTSSTTAIQFTSAIEESDASFGDEANNRLVIPVSGVYDFQMLIETDDGNDYAIFLGIKKGGVYCAMEKISTGSGRAFGSFSATALGVRCTAGDFITADIWHNRGSNVNLQPATNGHGTFLIGKWVRP